MSNKTIFDYMGRYNTSCYDYSEYTRRMAQNRTDFSNGSFSIIEQLEISKECWENPNMFPYIYTDKNPHKEIIVHRAVHGYPDYMLRLRDYFKGMKNEYK